MWKHVLWLSVAIATGIAASKFFSGTLNLASLLPGSTSSTTTPPCYLAAAVFEEDFFSGPRVLHCRRWLVDEFEPSGPFARFVMALYRRYGQRAAAIVARHGLLRQAFTPLFQNVLAQAERKYGAVQA